MNKVSKIIVLAISLLILFANNSWARTDEATDSSAEVEIDLLLSIPPHVSVQVGSKGAAVDTVLFNVTGLPSQMPVVRGNIAPQVIIVTNIEQGITLTADSSGGLSSESDIIPSSAISWNGTGDFSGLSGRFDGTSNQRIGAFSGKGTWKGNFDFLFDNSLKYPPGTYRGIFTFTVTTP